jgi:hypothetical protein
MSAVSPRVVFGAPGATDQRWLVAVWDPRECLENMYSRDCDRRGGGVRVFAVLEVCPG